MLITLLLAVLLLLSCGSIRRLTAAQTMQYEAERWQGPTEQRYCQVAVWLNRGELDAAQAAELEADLGTSFPTRETEAPIVTAFGTWEPGFAEYGYRKTDAELWQVSQDFFLLHSFPTVSGGVGGFGQKGDEAILNEAAAFALFGSFDCVGEAVRVGPLGRRVLAVVREPEGEINKAAFAGTPRVWLPIRADSELRFYEAILPEYYSGFAAQTLENVVGAPVTTSTGRFRLPRLWEAAKAFFQTPPTEQPQLPPWEQAARLAQRRLCLDWAIALLAASCIPVLLVPAAVRSIKKRQRIHA